MAQIKKYKVVLTIGHNVGKIEKWTAEIITRVFVEYTGRQAFTVYDVSGYWEGAFEKSTRIEVDDLSKMEADGLMEIVPVLAAALQQDCIMATCEESVVEFIGAIEIKKVVAA